VEGVVKETIVKFCDTGRCGREVYERNSLIHNFSDHTLHTCFEVVGEARRYPTFAEFKALSARVESIESWGRGFK
jgi:hypothetical protein